MLKNDFLKCRLDLWAEHKRIFVKLGKKIKGGELLDRETLHT